MEGFFLSRFFFTDTDDSQDTRGRKGTIFYFTLSPPSTQEHWTFIYKFECDMTIRYFWLYRLCLPDCYSMRFTTLSNYHLSDWFMMQICMITWWIDTRFLLHRFDIRNQWIWTRIAYHPCVTSKPTNQLC